MNALTDRQAWLFSIKTYLAAVAALYIAMAGNLSRPYWAMGTVYIVSQPLLGPTRAKGVYRIVGTLVAGLATLLVGGYRALRQTDIKLVLAYGTVSQLGFLMLVMGQANADAAIAGTDMLGSVQGDRMVVVLGGPELVRPERALEVVSQFATTLFNAALYAGLDFGEYQSHSLYISRYPRGHEATISYPAPDLEIENDTDYGVLVEAKLVKAAPGRQGSLTVTMWSTKTFDRVVSTKPVRTRVTTGRDLTDSSSDCEAQEPVAGFDVAFRRLFYRDGAIVKRERFSWRYAPTDRIRCA